MNRIKGQLADQEGLAKQVLSWIVCAKRPLLTVELQHALVVEVGEPELDEDNNVPQLEDMVSVCVGLVTVDEESGIIRLVHYTAQEFFQWTQAQWSPTAKKDICTICVTYLSFSQFKKGPCGTDEEFEKRLQSNPLYEYAARNWGNHAREASLSTAEVIGFLNSHDLVEAASQALLATKRWSDDRNYSQFFPKQMTGIHVAAYFGVVEVVTELIGEGLDIDPRDNWGRTPLSWAAENDRDAVVKLLL